MENRIGLPGADEAPCRARYTTGAAGGTSTTSGTDEIDARIEAAGVRLSGPLRAMARRAPKSRVYVVGYPAILPAKGAGYGRAMGLAPGDVSFLRQKEQRLDAMLRERAKTTGAVCVDTYAPFADHDACTDRGTRWIEPLVPSAPAAPVHPNGRGEHGMAQAVLRAIRDSR